MKGRWDKSNEKAQGMAQTNNYTTNRYHLVLKEKVVNCKKNIPCPKGGITCCIGCVLACNTRCSSTSRCKREKLITTATNFIAATLWWVILLLMFVLILVRFDHMETENNAIIDRLDKVEKTITDQINEKFPSEEFKDTEENLGGSFKSWMPFRSNNG